MNIAAQITPTKDCAFLFLTESCNLRCSHCYVDASPAVGKYMPLEVVTSAFNFLAELGINDIRLTGGEPSIHPDFYRILDLAKSRKIRLGLVSNGIRILNSIRRDEIFAGLARCWISLYGTSELVHSRVSQRAEKTFHETIAKVGELASKGYWIGLSVLASPRDSSAVDELMTLAYGAGIRKLRILPIQPDGRARGPSVHWSEWPAEISEIARIMKAHSLSFKFDTLTINDPFDLADRFEAGAESCLLRSRKMWSITPDGGVYPCCFTAYSDALLVGNVSDDGLADRLNGKSEWSSTVPGCRGLANEFWQDIVVKRIACPIGSIDPRSS